MSHTKSICLLAVLLLVGACSHDSKRDNPLDPALTPPVELQVALDDSTGTATLTWTPYAGSANFAAYLVLRNETESTRTETLSVIEDATQIAFADTLLKPNTAYEYRVVVRNDAGLEMPSATLSTQGFDLAGVQLLRADVDNRTGIVALRWRRYSDPGFGGYRLRRRVVGSDVVSVVAEVAGVNDTTFADDSVRAGVDYIYSVAVAAFDETFQSNSLEARLELPAVEITSLDLDSSAASATLQWSAYEGPRFDSYRVFRRAGQAGEVMLAQISDANVLSHVDSNLVGNTLYSYSVAVSTTVSESVEGGEESGVIHPQVEEWGLDMLPDEVVRLYAVGNGEITALVVGVESQRLFTFDSSDQITLEEGRLELSAITSPFARWPISPRSVSLAQSGNGRRFVSVSAESLSVFELSTQGQPLLETQILFPDAITLASHENNLLGEIVLSRVRGEVYDFITFDNVTVSSGGFQLLHEDFDGGEPSGWEIAEADFNRGVMYATASDGGATATTSDASWGESADVWTDLRVAFDAATTSGGHFSVRLGKPQLSTSFALLTFLPAVAQLQIGFQAPFSSDLESRSETLQEAFSVTRLAPVRVVLELVDHRVGVTVTMPKQLWQGDASALASIAADPLGDGDVLFVTNSQSATKIEPGSVDRTQTFDSEVAETRTGEIVGQGERWLGVCLPNEHQVLLRPSAEGDAWPAWPVTLQSNPTQRIGGKVGGDRGELLFPISFDLARDGRVYVLDAGNGRVQVFDTETSYITEWGTTGSEAGEFDFGSGNSPEDFRGSIAVDDEGFIYVADPGNKRIQKFAP